MEDLSIIGKNKAKANSLLGYIKFVLLYLFCGYKAFFFKIREKNYYFDNEMFLLDNTSRLRIIQQQNKFFLPDSKHPKEKKCSVNRSKIATSLCFLLLRGS